MSRRSRSRREQRDTSEITSNDLDRLLSPVSRPAPVVTFRQHVADMVPEEVEDLRQYSPDETSIARTVTGVPARVSLPVKQALQEPVKRGPGVKPWSPPDRGKFEFVAPDRVMVCLRRKMRREVLFAERRTRAGAGARRHRNIWSDVEC